MPTVLFHRQSAAAHPGLLIILIGISVIAILLVLYLSCDDSLDPTPLEESRPASSQTTEVQNIIHSDEVSVVEDEVQPERKPVVSLTDLSPKGDLSIIGHLLDDTGLPVEGVLIKTRPTYSNDSFAHVKTDGNGNFRFNGLEDKTYYVVVETDIGFMEKSHYFIKAGDTDVVINMTRYGRITGTFVNSLGVPVPSFTAWAGDELTNQRSEVSSFTDGLFDIRTVKPGKVCVVAHDRWETLSDVVEIKPGETICNITLVQVDRGGVSGIVLAQETREPLSGITVGVFNEDRRLPMKNGPSVIKTNQDGSFKIENLAPGTFTLWVVRNECTLARIKGIQVEGRKITEGIEITVSKCLSGIRGRVVVTGLPLNDIKVEIYQDDSGRESVSMNFSGEQWSYPTRRNCVTDAQGNYQIVNIPSGNYSVSATLPLGTDGETKYSLNIEVREDEIVQQDIIFENCTLNGRVLISGIPTRGVKISVDTKDDSSDCSGKTQTDDSGFYQISGLALGEYSVGATVINGGAPYGSFQDVTLKDGVTVFDFSFGDRGFGEVFGRITKNNQPVSEAGIDLRNDEFILHIVSDSDGYYRFTQIPPGEISLQVGLAQGEYTNGLVQEERLTLESGSTIEQNFDFRTGTGVLSGSVTVDEGPLETGLILLRLQTDREISTTNIQEVINDGQFRVQGLLTGKYNVWIRSPQGSRFITIDIQEGKEVSLEVAFETGNAIIEGMVMLPGEEESPSVFVLLYQNGANQWKTGDRIEPGEVMEGCISIGKADEEGCFTMEGVPVGSYKVVALHRNADEKTIVLATNHVVSSGKEGEVVNVQLMD